MPENLIVQPATIEDLPQLADLLFELFSHERDFTPDKEKQLRGLRLILEQPNRGRIFVLRNESHIIGMINLLITISTAEGGFAMILEDLIVHRDFRGHGFGRRLLEYAEEFAVSKGFLRITLLMDHGDNSLKQFYLRHGFVESDMIPMRKFFRE